ncbi:MAG TPA: pyruvate, phosphate dikinase [Clostridia bacterium]|nr:pyruvate, phosphate dikinase [Clostridia bacterium]
MLHGREPGEKRLVYAFEEGNKDMRGLLGGKGANLAEMTLIGLPVPPGFTISTEACREYLSNGKKFPEGLENALEEYLRGLEEKTNRVFGNRKHPLLVSVRSGAPVSMPGMMDTVLNLGLNSDTVEGLAEETADPRFAWDCYRRFVQMFGNVVLGIDHEKFEAILDRKKAASKAASDQELKAEELKSLVAEYLEFIKQETGKDFPQDPKEQILLAVRAVFDSWNNHRAIVYRKIHRIPDDLGTAVNVQVMVFGNMGEDSGTGVLFTRNPSTGEPGIYGEYLPNAQGEDVVAGIRTPIPISAMKETLPHCYEELVRISGLLENHYRDMQDIEFTIEKSKVYVLQTRTGKRSARAAVKIAVDMAKEGLIGKEEAILRVEPEQIVNLLHKGVDPDARLKAIAVGLPASPGAATGKAVFTADTAEVLGQRGEKVILVRPETTPDDMHGIVYAQGILTSRGGMTCHAAIVARGMGKPCVVGCDALKIDVDARRFSVDDRDGAGVLTFKEGDVISIDGLSGRVFAGEVPMVSPELTGEFQTLLEWCDETKSLGVRANADTPQDAALARSLGATGIGLCRTEHMFMAPERLDAVQEMILASDEAERRRALSVLLPMQRGDFEGILEAMDGLPVTIRLLDPPLHEFLPRVEDLMAEIDELRAVASSDENAKERIRKNEDLLRKATSLSEANPMLGFRGCRLGIVYPEIYEMQARAIFEATVALIKRGKTPRPEVMIPLVSIPKELEVLRERVSAVADKVMEETGVSFEYTIGTMIEVPRAALMADEVADFAEFFSFGTNDLTQTTFGFSRDDAEAKFLHHYIHNKIIRDNPFSTLDTDGVGKLIRTAVKLGRKAKPWLKIGICGEHGGDPASIAFCHEAGLDYVSCSPYRVPVARLAAAQAAIKARKDVTDMERAAASN